MSSLSRSIIQKEKLDEKNVISSRVGSRNFFGLNLGSLDLSQALFFDDQKSFVGKVREVINQNVGDMGLVLVDVLSLKKEALENLFEERLLLVGLSSSPDDNRWGFVFIHAPSCRQLSRFFRKPYMRQQNRYSRSLFNCADTLVPLYEKGSIIPNSLAMMEGIWKGSRGSVEGIHLIGVGVEQMGDRDAVVFSSARPSIQIK